MRYLTDDDVARIRAKYPDLKPRRSCRVIQDAPKSPVYEFGCATEHYITFKQWIGKEDVWKRLRSNRELSVVSETR